MVYMYEKRSLREPCGGIKSHLYGLSFWIGTEIVDNSSAAPYDLIDDRS